MELGGLRSNAQLKQRGHSQGSKGKDIKTNQECGGECGRIPICLWLGASGKGMQKEGMEGLCVRKGQSRRTAGV